MSCEIDIKILKEAINLSKNCPPSQGAYSVGAIIVDEKSNIISTGFSRETAENVHAEEVAINKAILAGVDLRKTTIYSTMEPCGLRLSGKLCCADRIINSGIGRVVFGIKEPPIFVSDANGIGKLLEHGVIVEQIECIIPEVLKVNEHLKK